MGITNSAKSQLTMLNLVILLWVISFQSSLFMKISMLFIHNQIRDAREEIRVELSKNLTYVMVLEIKVYFCIDLYN